MRGRRARARTLILPIAVLAGTSLLAALLLFPLDGEISRAMRAEPAGVRAFLSYMTDIGLIQWYFYPAVVVLLLLLATDAQPAGRRLRLHLFRAGFHCAYLAASLGLSTTITHVLKWFLGRARPDLLDQEGPFSFMFLRMGPAFESFPSGHSSNMGALAVVLAIWFPSVRWPILIAGAALALTRIVVEAHFPSDVVTGFAIGALTALSLGRYLALRRIVYRVCFQGCGWRGLLPYRPAAPVH